MWSSKLGSLTTRRNEELVTLTGASPRPMKRWQQATTFSGPKVGRGRLTSVNMLLKLNKYSIYNQGIPTKEKKQSVALTIR